MKKYFLFYILFFNSYLWAMQGETSSFFAPNGSSEKCIITSKIENGIYSESDVKQEKKLCAVEFYDIKNVALCPKLWSTTAATLIYDISALGTNANLFEPMCPQKKEAKPIKVKSIAKYKQSISADGTSSISIKGLLANYHLSRLLNFGVKVPPVVYREMNLQTHLSRVTLAGVKKANNSYNINAWKFYLRGEQNPSGSNAQKFFVLPSRDSIFGAMYKDVGDKYGLEFTGSEDADGGNGPFMATAPFVALKSNQPLLTAIKNGNSKAGKNHSPLQMAKWMKDLSEIVLIDYLLGQEDRIGNIDFTLKWYYVQNGEVKSREEKDSGKSAKGALPPDDIAQFAPILVKETHMSDNDESVLDWTPENYARDGGALKSISHISSDLFRRLHFFNSNFESGKNYREYFKSVLNFSESDVKRLRQFTSEAVSILSAKCKSKSLRFDLDSPEHLLIEAPLEQKVNCEGL